MTSQIQSTDVPATIAGFYYQILLACRELSAMAIDENCHESDAVGVEQGADVKIKKHNGNSTSIEAKFYKDNLKQNSDAITHTIANFYKNSFNDE